MFKQNMEHSRDIIGYVRR